MTPFSPKEFGTYQTRNADVPTYFSGATPVYAPDCTVGLYAHSGRSVNHVRTGNSKIRTQNTSLTNYGQFSYAVDIPRIASPKIKRLIRLYIRSPGRGALSLMYDQAKGRVMQAMIP